MRLLVVLLCLLGISCSGQKGVSKNEADSSLQDSEKLQLVLADNYSRVEQSEFRVIRDSKTLKHFFLQINKTRKPGLEVPEVDFTQTLLLVYCAGTTVGAYRLELVVIEESLDTLIVGLKEQSATSIEAAQITTTPFLIYKMPLTSKEISFKALR